MYQSRLLDDAWTLPRQFQMVAHKGRGALFKYWLSSTPSSGTTKSVTRLGVDCFRTVRLPYLDTSSALIFRIQSDHDGSMQ